MPSAIKVHVKNVVETMLKTKSRAETDKVFTDVYNVFKTLTVQEIAAVRGISEYEKYSLKCNGFQTCKAMPSHVKAAYFYNLLIDKLGIQRKYEKISSGDKVRHFYVRQPNKYGLKMIGYKYDFPTEFKDIFEPDYELTFEKEVYAVIERFYEAVKWKLKKPSEQVQTDLFELLGV